ncbi:MULTISPECIES: SDR family NAD(P)-dependent oxidoreductase [Dyella]|uniref:SDR family oxidoreductase n=2 Tax=Dyella TaxID=231454 RepID=A0A4R0YGE4_9GAMM|nr:MULTISPECIES: SDR family oxidoreductase [Dyella]TBR36337.1 SDR family oxidoreductase [Dyella terrae]TCI05994.1 SDR family oxidoreductase [Dyella soli]
MNIDLSGKNALVTASTAGIGWSIAAGLAASGANVILNGRKPEVVQAAVEKLRRELHGANVEGVAADLSTAKGVQGVIDAVPSLDILVNNAGIFGPEPFFDVDDATWERYFQTNVMSGVRLSRYYMQGMLQRNWGRVVFISSESGLNIPADMIHYGVSKTAQIALANGLAKLAAGSGVTVNSVLPGPTLSDGFREMVREQHEREGTSYEEIGNDFVRKERATSIIQRISSTEEIANMVVYVCSPQASATTGVALRVDGGVVNTW